MATCHHEPIYRPVLREAFTLAWKEKRLWIVSVLAGITLTGSVYDVIWRGMNALAPKASILGAISPFWMKATETWPGLTVSELVIGSLNVLLITAFLLLITFAIFASSIIAQSTVVYALGARRRGRIPTFRDALTVGARALWPVLALNIMALCVLWATRALIAIALAFIAEQPTALTYLLYLVSFIVIIAIGALAIVIQVFALNAIILQGATLAQAIVRGFEVVRRHWVTVVETAAILFVISVGAYVLTITASLLLALPYALLLLISVVVKSGFLFAAISVIFIALFVMILLLVFGFTVQLHYATWTLMYRRLGEGGVLPKLHRIARRFIHGKRINA